MGYLDDIIEDDIQKRQAKAREVPAGVSKGLLDTLLFGDAPQGPEPIEVQRHFKPTGAISTITGKPETEFVGEGGSGASFAAHVWQGFADDPMTKVRVYAKDRFPNLSEEEAAARYKYQDGEVLYKADDGKWYSESPDLFHHKAKKSIGAFLPHAPSAVLGAAGEATFGIPGAMAGSGFGEIIRKGVAVQALGEPKQTIGGYAKDVGIEGAMGAVGVAPGRATVRAGRKALAISGGRKGMKVVRVTGKDTPIIDFKKAYKIKKKYHDEFGVDLFDGQTTGSRRLLDKINLYGDMPQTADLVAAAKEIQDEQAYNAVTRYFDDIAPAEDVYDVGEGLTTAAQKSIDRDIGARKAKAGPYYKKAFAADTKVDLTPHIQQLDEMIELWPLNTPERKKLEGFRNMMFREVKGPKGDTWLIPEDRLRVIDRLKKSTDTYLKPSAIEPNVAKEVKRDIREVKNNILADADKANKDYQIARQLWADDSIAIDRLVKKTRLKKLADLEGEDVTVATRRLFANVGGSPKVLKGIRDRIIREDPVVWQKALRTHIDDLFNQTKGSAAAGAQDSSKRFAAFWRNTVGDPRQRKLLQAAMGGKNTEQWRSFAALTDMLRRVSWVARKESTTAIRQQSLREEQAGLVKGMIKAYAYPLITFKKVIWDKLQDLQTDRGRKLMAEALLDTRTKNHVLKIRRMGIKTEKGIRAFSTFLSLVLGGEYRRHGTDLYKSYRHERIDKKH